MVPNPVNRRTVLQATASGLGVLFTGCVSAPISSTNQPRTEPDTKNTTAKKEDGVETGSWTTFQANFGRTGYRSDVQGPAAPAKRAWSFETDSPTVLCSPAIADGTVYTASSGTPGYLFSIDVTDGTKQWRYELKKYATAVPTVTKERVLIGGRSGRVYALDRQTGSEVWTKAVDRPIGSSSPAIDDGTLYIGTMGKEPSIVDKSTDATDFAPPLVLALDMTTGEKQWRYDRFPPRDSIVTSVAINDGSVYVASKSGVVCSLDAETGTEQWRRQVSGTILSDATIINDTVYFGEHGTGVVRALAAQTGVDRWSVELGGDNVKSSPAVADGVLYIGSHVATSCLPEDEDCEGGVTGYLQAINVANGAVDWTFETRNDIHSSPAVGDNGIYFGRGNGVTSIGHDGTQRWDIELGKPVESSPAIADGRLVIGCKDGKVYAIEPSS